MATHPYDIEDNFGPRLWDATPGVCCAAFQLGACSHTEGEGYDYEDDEDYMPVFGPPEPPAAADDEPF